MIPLNKIWSSLQKSFIYIIIKIERKSREIIGSLHIEDSDFKLGCSCNFHCNTLYCEKLHIIAVDAVLITITSQ